MLPHTIEPAANAKKLPAGAYVTLAETVEMAPESSDACQTPPPAIDAQPCCCAHCGATAKTMLEAELTAQCRMKLECAL